MTKPTVNRLALRGRFELRQDEDGRRYWWGAEDGWKDPTEIGEDGVLTMAADGFKLGTVLEFYEPDVPSSGDH